MGVRSTWTASAQEQYRSPQPPPQRTQRRDRAQRPDERDRQAATAAADGDLRSSTGTGGVVGHGTPEAESTAGSGTVQGSARPDMRPLDPPAAECTVQEVTPCNTDESAHGPRVPNLPGIHSDPASEPPPPPHRPQSPNRRLTIKSVRDTVLWT